MAPGFVKPVCARLPTETHGYALEGTYYCKEDAHPKQKTKNNKSIAAMVLRKGFHCYSGALSLLRSYCSWRQRLMTLSNHWLETTNQSLSITLEQNKDCKWDCVLVWEGKFSFQIKFPMLLYVIFIKSIKIKFKNVLFF